MRTRKIDWDGTGKLLVLALVMGLLITATIVVAWNAVPRIDTAKEEKRCTFLARLLANELNRPDAVDLIRARCLQSK